MTEKEQIEKMALVLSECSCGKECDCIEGDKFNCHLLYNATVLYNAGYRKQSEVVWEIFDAIKEKLIFNSYGIATISDKTFYELRKKYIGE